MGWGGWGSIIGAALGGLGGYLGGKDAAKQKGPWSKKHAMWALDEARRLYGGSVMAPMFRAAMYNKSILKGGDEGMKGLMDLWAARYGQYNPGGNPYLGGGGYLGETTTPKSYKKYTGGG
jgi:hypothetical protein